jgi:hypothetical protein
MFPAEFSVTVLAQQQRPPVMCAPSLQVSSFIIQAKEKADQEQELRAAQQPPKPVCRPGVVGGLTAAQLQAALLHGVAAAPPNHHQTQQLYQVQQTQQQQQVMLPVMTSEGLQQQLLVAGGYPVAHTGSISFADANSLQQQQFVGSNSGSQQLQLSALHVDGSSYVLVSSPLTAADSVSSMSCLNSSLSSSNSTASSYMLCSTPSGQTIVLPVASPGMNNGSGDASLLLQPQQQVVQQQMVQLQHIPQQQQVQQPQLLLVSANGTPLQLSVQPELVTIAGHLSAAAAGPSGAAELLSDPPGLQQQQQFLQQQLQDLSMLDTMPPSSLGYNSTLQDWQLAGQQQFVGGGNAATAAAGSPMLQTVLAGSFPPVTAQGGSGNRLCATGSMSMVPLAGYASSAAAALASGSSANDTNGARLPQQPQQHQLLVQLSGAMLHDCSSSNCSPMLTAMRMPASGTAGSNGVSSMMCNRACVPATAGLSADARGQVGSPTSSSCSSGCGGQVLVGVGGGYAGVSMF